MDISSNIEEDFDIDDGSEHEDMDSSPINLSIRKSRPSTAQPVQSDTPDKAQKKSNPISEKEKLSKLREKVEPEKKVTTRQKKIDKVNESPAENTSVKETQTQIMTAAVNTENKGKRRVKKLPTEKTTVHDQAGVPQSQKDTMETEKCDPQRPVEEGVVRKKVGEEDEKLRPEKEKEPEKNESSGKENKSLNKPRKSGSKKSEKITERIEGARQKPDSPEKSQKEKVVKEKGAKRKAVEALDLSTKPVSETTSKAKRLKAMAAEKLQSKPAPEDTNKTDDATATPLKSSGKQKKTRNSSKKATGLQLPVDPAKERTTSVNSQSTEAPEASAKMDKTNTLTHETAPTAPENNTSENMDVSPSCSSGEATPSSAENHPAPTFLKPTSPPSLMLPSQRTKPTDQEDDEGIHSSHEGGSDISDSASEGSDDSGLHSRSSKMANDPETPTDEIPTPTELKSHMCIFCDRTFPLEVEYRRHLNRHLVNVYYMDSSAAGQK